jgi:outer membrane lipopolysaccharide assembly protein LptE/RlpB
MALGHSLHWSQIILVLDSAAHSEHELLIRCDIGSRSPERSRVYSMSVDVKRKYTCPEFNLIAFSRRSDTPKIRNYAVKSDDNKINI